MLSRELASTFGVPVATGTAITTSDDVRAFTRAQGFPVMVKALDGGGGRGIRVVSIEDEVEEAFQR